MKNQNQNPNISISQNFRNKLLQKELKIEGLQETINLIHEEKIKISFGNSLKEKYFNSENLRCFDTIVKMVSDELKIELEKANYELKSFIEHNTFKNELE